MAGDSEEFTGRKQRRSSTSDESEEPSKRRKHRHHRHHRSRKHAEEEPKREEEVEAESKCEEKEEVVLHQNHPPIISVPRTAYDDMEEGEIVEDDGFGGGHADIVNKRADSDVESGEIKAGEVLGDFHNYNMGIHGSHVEHELNFGLTLEDSLDRSGKNPKLLGAEKRGKELMINLALDEHAHMSDGSKDDDGDRFIGNSSSENHINGNIGREPFKEISRPLTGSQSPVAGSCKQKSYYDDGRDLKDPKKPSSSEKNGNGHKKEARPPSHDRYHEEIHSRTRLKFHGQVRDRSQSRSVLEE
ncbi:non-specific serine,threonine protein kinase, partial [Sarracenia purpurea var. burkii]